MEVNNKIFDKIYLYGAGENGLTAIHFLGRDRIKAFIDSDPSKIGKKLGGVDIISFDDYMCKDKGAYIYITAYSASKSIEKFLNKNHIESYGIAPWFEAFYCNIEEIIKDNELAKYDKIVISDEDPILNLLKEKLNDLKISCVDNLSDASGKYCVIILEKKIGKAEKNVDTINLQESYNNKIKQELSVKLKKYKDIHKGKRCFIIGNGPSLQMSDLEILYKNKEICFGVNRIFLGFKDTEWRPDYYVALDYLLIDNMQEELKQIYDIDKFIRFNPHYKVSDMMPNTNEFIAIVQEDEQFDFSTDISEGICTGETVVYAAIQIAAYMGFSDIYLLGVDMSMKALGLNAQDEGAHFYKSPDVNENFGQGNVDTAIEALAFSERYLKKYNVHLYNATRNAIWDDVTKVDFDKLF